MPDVHEDPPTADYNPARVELTADNTTTTNEVIVAAGGWTAPTEVLYDIQGWRPEVAYDLFRWDPYNTAQDAQ